MKAYPSMPIPRVGTSWSASPDSPIVTNPTRSVTLPSLLPRIFRSAPRLVVFSASSALRLLERFVKGLLGRLEIKPVDKCGCFRGALVPVHAAVLPLHGERSLIADSIQRPHDL